MAFENGFTQRTDAEIDKSQNKIEHPLLKRVHVNAQRVLIEEAISPTTFSELYGSENVIRDLQRCEALKSKFETNDTKAAADIFEAIMLQHTELSEWLGPNAETIRTSEYDDFINGVDLVLEFNENEATQHLALGVDVTFGSQAIQKKFDRIIAEIESDELAAVKYFRTHGYEGSLKQLPRVVVGVDIDKVINLAGLWERRDNNALKNHIAKDIIAEEIERQLHAFFLFAQRIKAENAIRSYTRALATMRRVRTVRNGFTDDKSRAAIAHSDQVFQEIISNLQRFK